MIRLALAGTGADGGTRRAFSLAQTFGLFSSPDVHVWGERATLPFLLLPSAPFRGRDISIWLIFVAFGSLQ